MTFVIESSFFITIVYQIGTYRKAKSALLEKVGVESLNFKEVIHGNADNNLEPSILHNCDKACAETLQGKPKFKNIIHNILNMVKSKSRPQQ